MGELSLNQITGWVIESVNGNPEWQNLSNLCIEVLTIKMPKWSSTEITDYVEERIQTIEEALRNQMAASLNDGEAHSYELDNETPPFLRATKTEANGLLRKLRRMDPSNFEKVCAIILEALGAAASEVIGGTNDGGVDFLGYNFSQVHHEVPVPVVSRAIVIGQAKRYKGSVAIRETDLRKFVGGAIKRADELRTRSDFGVLSPVLYAFWTTSYFDSNAKTYARKMGLWFMNGYTLASYITNLKIEDKIEALLDN